MKKSPAALILAAGQGKRMRSRLPKVLHRCADVPLVCHVVRLALAQGCDPIVVVVSPSTAEAVEASLAQNFPGVPLRYAVQPEPLGTGDAARFGLQALEGFAGHVLVLYGDVPLLTAETLTRLGEAAAAVPLAFLTAVVPEPFGYGRIVRNQAGDPVRVVEHRDASAKELAICEINAGVYWVRSELLSEAVSQLVAGNAQQEYYLTDVVDLAAKRGGAVAVTVTDLDEVRGINSRAELAVAERLLQKRIIAKFQEQGVTFQDPLGTFVGLDVEFGADVQVGMGVQLYGKTHVGPGARVDGPTVVMDTYLGANSQVRSFCHLEKATVEADAVVGPFARLRPQAHLEEGAHVGNFVELKKARLGKGAKANHLAYIGDADIGAGSNVGAGTITCNYDGYHKHRTEIGEGVFVGSNSTLVAPLRIGSGAFVAAGSTVTADVPAEALALGRAVQTNREGYAPRLRDRLKKKKER